jgi:hypothetical protein
MVSRECRRLLPQRAGIQERFGRGHSVEVEVASVGGEFILKKSHDGVQALHAVNDVENTSFACSIFCQEDNGDGKARSNGVDKLYLFVECPY